MSLLAKLNELRGEDTADKPVAVIPEPVKPSRARGKKRGRKSGSGKGRQAITRSVTMPADQWAAFDALRGDQSKGRFLSGLLALMGK